MPVGTFWLLAHFLRSVSSNKITVSKGTDVLRTVVKLLYRRFDLFLCTLR